MKDTKKKFDWPKISVIIPTRGIKNHPFYDSEKYVKACLDSVFKQDYPKDKLEVIVVDGGSTDRTLKIAKSYPVKILHNKKKLAEPAKTLGFKHATGELFFYLDSDAELVSSKWFKKIVTPLIREPELAGSFTRYLPNKEQKAINRYLSFNPLQLWGMLSFLLPSIRQATIREEKDYKVIHVGKDESPPTGICMFRKKLLDKIIKNPDTFVYVDVAIPLQLAKLGYDKLAYVEDAGLYHRRNTLKRELQRQKRDVTVTYLPFVGKRDFDYVDFSNPVDLLKIVSWVIWVNLLIPSLLIGIYKSIKFRDLAGMLELPVNLLLTDYIVYLFLSDPHGRKLIKKVLFR